MPRKLSKGGSSHGASVAGGRVPRPSARGQHAPAQPTRAASPPAGSSPEVAESTDVAYGLHVGSHTLG